MKTARKDSKINAIANARWTAYLAAAAATGFSANSAEAAIHYSGPVNQAVFGHQLYRFSLGPRARFEALHINWVAGSSSFSAGGRAELYFQGVKSAAVNGAFCTCDGDSQVCAAPLKRRDPISMQPFTGAGSAFLASDFYWNFWNSCGNFQDPTVGFVGFKFNNGAGNQYGWVRVETLGGPRNYFKVVDYAYADPGEPIAAGQKRGPTESAPELESLGGLALGAAGLLAWRKSRSRAAR